jgi:hypothetical protein
MMTALLADALNLDAMKGEKIKSREGNFTQRRSLTSLRAVILFKWLEEMPGGTLPEVGLQP